MISSRSPIPRLQTTGNPEASPSANLVGHEARFEGIPDVHYGDDAHFACGNRGVSEWTISGTTLDGERIEVRGCDLWTFGDDDRLTRKDSFWKIRES